MILEKAVVVVAVLVSYFLQTSVDFFRLGDIKPDFLLILTIYFSIYRGDFSGLWVGFFGGLLQDIYLGGVAAVTGGAVRYYIGTHSLPKALIGYFAGKISKGINKDGYSVLVLLVLAFSLGKGFLTFFIVAIFHGSVAAQSLITIVFPEAIYNAILSFIWFRVLRWALPFQEAASGGTRGYL